MNIKSRNPKQSRATQNEIYLVVLVESARVVVSLLFLSIVYSVFISKHSKVDVLFGLCTLCLCTAAINWCIFNVVTNKKRTYTHTHFVYLVSHCSSLRWLHRAFALSHGRTRALFLALVSFDLCICVHISQVVYTLVHIHCRINTRREWGWYKLNMRTLHRLIGSFESLYLHLI